MELVTQDQLDEILDNHKKWLESGLDCGSYGKSANLSNRILKNLNFKYVNLSGAIFRNTSLVNCDLSYANLFHLSGSNCKFIDCNLRSVDFTEAFLANANLTCNHLINTNFTKSYLRGVDFSCVIFDNTTIREANLDQIRTFCTKNLINGGERSDGFNFWATVCNNNLMIKAGCRWFTLAEAREHWEKSRTKSDRLYMETEVILDFIEKTARIRDMI